MDSIQLLMRFGLTLQEARIYSCLHQSGRATGYELAKATSISRSNTYAALSSLTEKGAAYKVDGKPVRYVAVHVMEFCQNVIRGLQEASLLLEAGLPVHEDEDEGYITVQGSQNIRNKIETMILETTHHIYVSMPRDTLEGFLPFLRELAEKQFKVVIITDGELDMEGVTLYLAENAVQHIRIISDTANALTGILDETPTCSCLFSAKENLVSLLRDSMRNEIQLIELSGGKDARRANTFIGEE